MHRAGVVTQPSLLPSPNFLGLTKYCATRHLVNWTRCPPLPQGLPPLELDDLFFAVLTSDTILHHRGAVMSRVLGRQRARYGLFSDSTSGSSGVRALPVTGLLETIFTNSSLTFPKPKAEKPGLIHLAQKQLELLHTLHRDSLQQETATDDRGLDQQPRQRRRTRWWVICDDDSFVFAGRLMQYLSLLDDRQAVVAGGAQSRSHLCGNGLCDLKAYKAAHGVVPGIFGFAGGTCYAFSDPGIRRVGRAIEQGRCLDAAYTDIASATCAMIANLSLRLLPGGSMINDPYSIKLRMRREVQAARDAYDAWAKRYGRTPGGAATLATNMPPPTGRDEKSFEAEKLDKMQRAVPFAGQLVVVHKLTDRQALCWAQHGECSRRCDCTCPCVAANCTEPPGLGCDFECPPRSVLAQAVTNGGLLGGEWDADAGQGSPIGLERQLRETRVCIGEEGTKR